MAMVWRAPGLRKLHKRQQRWQQLDGLSPALQRLVDTPVPPANTLLADYPGWRLILKHLEWMLNRHIFSALVLSL
ncbi:hypothetical protein ABC733_25190 [Mangrovibacter sp. SLW1]